MNLTPLMQTALAGLQDEQADLLQVGEGVAAYERIVAEVVSGRAPISDETFASLVSLGTASVARQVRRSIANDSAADARLSRMINGAASRLMASRSPAVRKRA